MKVKGHGVSDAELGNLSDEEREALEEGAEQDEQDAAALASIAAEGKPGAKAAAEEEDGDDAADEGEDGEDAGDDGEDEGADAEDKKGAAAEEEEEEEEEEAAADAGKGAQAAEAEAEAEAEVEEEEEAETVAAQRHYRAPPVENYDAQMKALDEQRTKAKAEFQSGDLELDAMLGKLEEIDTKKADLREAKLKHDISSEMASQSEAAEWKSEIDSFMKRVLKAEGLDYADSRKLGDALDAEVKKLGNDEANKDKSGRWFLETAHANVKKQFGIGKAGAADQGQGGGKGKEGAGKPAARKPNLKVVPKTLGGLPAAGSDDAGGDPEFAGLDGLDGLELEDEIAKMSPAQQERYARAR